MYLINLVWNVCNKTTNLQAKTYFPLQNILNMILTRRVNNEVGMQIVRNSLAVLDVSILFQDFFVTFLLHLTYTIVSEVLRLITEL